MTADHEQRDTTASTRALAIQLVDAWGDAERMAALLAGEAEWWAPPTAGVMGSPARGRETIVAGLRRVFGRLYDPATVRVSVHAVVAEGAQAAVRLTMTATTMTQKAYTNEYAIFVTQSDGHICQITEYVDVATALHQIKA